MWEVQQRTGGWRSSLTWRALSFTTGLLTLFLALISPLDALATAFFSAHMVQHMPLIVIAPLLLALSVGISPTPFLRALPRSTQRKLGQWGKRSQC